MYLKRFFLCLTHFYLTGLRELALAVEEEETLMYFKTDQGQIRLTENCNHGIVMTVDDDEFQSKASMTIETAKRFAKELNTIIERIEK